MAIAPKTKLFLDTYHPTSDKRCAVKLEVYFDRKRKHYLTGHRLTEEEYRNIYTVKPKKKQKEILEDLILFEEKANGIIDSLKGRFSFVLFKKMFETQKGNSSCIFKLMEEKAINIRAEGRISTAVVLECAVKSIKDFYQKSNLSFDIVDVSFLKNYEKWMKDKGNSNATIGMYLRTLRTIFNDQIEEGTIPKELYPFKGKKGYTIPTGRNVKKALILPEIALIYKFKPKTSSQQKAKDFWLFSYIGNGINVKDIAKLKFKNIDGEMIRFERSKTDQANKDQPTIISFAITPDIKRIIKKWGNKSTYSGNYIFPILRNNITPEQEYNLVQLFTKFINKNMQKVASELELKSNITTYVARHSFSTIIRNSGGSVDSIKEALGHKSVKTTENYLADFDDTSKKEMATHLTKFD